MLKKLLLVLCFFSAAVFGKNFDIKSLTFVEKGNAYVAPEGKGIFFQGVKVPDGIIFRHEMEMYLGLKSNSSTLKEIKSEVEQFYWRRGYDDVVVSVPEQNCESGHLFLEIISPAALQEVEYVDEGNLPGVSKNYPYDESRPSPVPPEGEGRIYNLVPPPVETGPSMRSDKILVRQLKGIYFFSDAKEAKRSLHYEKGIHVAGDEFPSMAGLASRLEVFLQRPITLSVLKRLQEEVVAYYHEIGYSLVNVILPPGQDISSGYVRAIVLFGHLGKITCTGARFFSNEKIAASFGIKPGEIINSARVLEDLNWVNNSPYRAVSLYYQPGDKDGEANIVLRVKDRVPMRLYAGYLHSGYEVAGASRWTMGLNTGRVFGLDDQFNAQFMCAMRISNWWSLSGNYVLPLPWRNYLKFYGNVVRATAEPELQSSYQQQGKSWYVGGRYEIPLPILYKLVHDFAIGYDFKHTNNFLSVASNLLYNNYTDISEFLLKYSGSVPDNFGVNTFGITLVLSPGRMTHYNTDFDFNAQREGSKANYIYATGSYDRATRLPCNFSFLLNFFAQIATGKLLPTEELSVGGQYTVRGYKENAVVGDMGFILRNELRTPSWGLLFRRVVALKDIRDEMQWLLFVDVGWAGQVDKNVVDASSDILASIGPGLRYKIEDFLELRFDYGVQLRNNKDRIVDNGTEGRGHLSIQLSY